jgi:hypothetical protein
MNNSATTLGKTFQETIIAYRSQIEPGLARGKKKLCMFWLIWDYT